VRCLLEAVGPMHHSGALRCLTRTAMGRVGMP